MTQSGSPATSLTRDHPLSQTSLCGSKNSNDLLNPMNDNDTPPPIKVPPILKDLNSLLAKSFLKQNHQYPHGDKDAAEKKLSDGRNPLTLKDDPQNN